MSSSHSQNIRERKKFQSVARPDSGAGSSATPPKTPRAAALRATSTDGLTAVVVVHGMGQQLPFETLDAVVEGLLRYEASLASGPRTSDGKSARRANEANDSVAADPSARIARETHTPPSDTRDRDHETPQLRDARDSSQASVRLARVGGVDLPRAELTLGARTDAPRRVHLYESYWAPLTEGEVTLRDVTRFLWGAAWNGRNNAKSKRAYFRFMFDQWCRFDPQTSARRHLTLAALVLGALTVLNAATTALFAAAVLGKGIEASKSVVPWSKELVSLGALVVACAIVLAIVCGWLMFRTRKMILFAVLLGDVIAAAVAIVVLFALAAVGRAPSVSIPGADWLASPWFAGVFWALLLGASMVIRQLLVQYVGDVAVYVVPHALDRFFELRQKIKQAVREVVQAVYRDRGADGRPTYERVAVVGHSLGSVAAYDALNALINLDALDPSSAVDVVKRTCLFLTFGSPLDKTAFIFGEQGRRKDEKRETREALAAAVQPMIQDYAYREFPWINIYSPADIISGWLFLYDDPKLPENDPRRVQNLKDPKASTPLVAHTQYWKSSMVFERLHGALMQATSKSS